MSPDINLSVPSTPPTETGIVESLNDNLDPSSRRFDTSLVSLRDLIQIREHLPATRELYPDAAENGEFLLPDIAVVHAFAESQLQPLGATTMRVQEVPGADLSADHLMDLFGADIIPIATESQFRSHDLGVHLVGAITLPEIPTQIFRQIARLGIAMRRTDPETATALATRLAYAFDYMTLLSKRFIKDYSGYTDHPTLLTYIHTSLDSTRGFNRQYGSDRLIENAKLAQAIEMSSLIADVPEEARVTYTADTKLGRWAEWEARNMPAYAAKVMEVLAQKPPQTRLRKLSTSLGRRTRHYFGL